MKQTSQNDVMRFGLISGSSGFCEVHKQDVDTTLMMYGESGCLNARWSWFQHAHHHKGSYNRLNENWCYSWGLSTFILVFLINMVMHTRHQAHGRHIHVQVLKSYGTFPSGMCGLWKLEQIGKIAWMSAGSSRLRKLCLISLWLGVMSRFLILHTIVEHLHTRTHR